MLVDDGALDRTVRECIAEYADVFGGFYHPYLTDYAQQLMRWQASWDGQATEVDLPRVAGSLLRSLLAALTATGGRTLIAAFRSGRDATSPGYAEIHEWISGEHGRAAVLDRFPELGRLLRLQTGRHLASALDVLTSAAQDRQVLRDVFGVRGPVTSVVTGLGDTHRGGKTVCFVHWSNRLSVIYKPHPPGGQELLTRLLPLADADGSFFGPLLPRTVARPTYLWQERVAHADVDGTEGTARYFRRFGRAAAVLSMLGASDLHHENVIAVAEGPVVIDTETLVSLPVIADFGTDGALLQDIAVSALKTLLFPARFAGRDLGIDLSAIGSVQRGQSERLRGFKVVDAGTDEIRFAHVPATVRETLSMATVRGAQIDPCAWVDEITAGFHEARERLRARRDAIAHTVAQSQGWAVRHILRPTFVYGRFLDASTHPRYLASTADRAALLRKLPRSRRGVGSEAVDALHEAEVQALLDLDIPFFEVDCDTRGVRCNGESEVPDAVLVTPGRAALASTDDFFDRPPGRDLVYIRYALASSVDDAWSPRGVPAGGRSGGGLSLTDPAGWHASLRELVVKGDRGPTWLMPELDGPRRLQLSSVNALPSEGGGMLVYLAQLGAAGPLPADGVGEAYAQAVPPDLSLDPVPQSVSPFTGALSCLVTGLELQRRGTAQIALPDLAASPAKVDVDQLSVDDFDYLNGFGGYLVYLARYADQGAPHLVDLAPPRLLDRLVEVDGRPDRHAGALGLAHGRFGRIAAMTALAEQDPAGDGAARAHLERFAAAYLRHRWTDEALRDQAARAGWCKGYAGVAYAMTGLLAAAGFAASEIRILITPEVEHLLQAPLDSDISICHGVAGRLAMLCWLADRLHWPELRSQARALNTRFVGRYGSGGWSCGVGPLPDLPSFLFGLSGWYYVQRMIEDRSVRLPQCLGGG